MENKSAPSSPQSPAPESGQITPTTVTASQPPPPANPAGSAPNTQPTTQVQLPLATQSAPTVTGASSVVYAPGYTKNEELSHGHRQKLVKLRVSQKVKDAIDANEMNKYGPSDLTFQDWLAYITICHIYLNPHVIFPGSNIRSIQSSVVDQLSHGVAETGFIESGGGEMYIMEDTTQPDRYLSVEGMHRVTALQKRVDADKSNPENLFRFSLVRKLTAEEMIYTGSQLNKIGDRRYSTNMVSMMEMHRRGFDLVLANMRLTTPNADQMTWYALAEKVKPVSVWAILEPKEHKEWKDPKTKADYVKRTGNQNKGGAPSSYRDMATFNKNLMDADFEKFMDFLRRDFKMCQQREAEGKPQLHGTTQKSEGYCLSLKPSHIAELTGLSRQEPNYPVDHLECLWLVMGRVQNAYLMPNGRPVSISELRSIVNEVIGWLQERQRVSELFWPENDDVLGNWKVLKDFFDAGAKGAHLPINTIKAFKGENEAKIREEYAEYFNTPGIVEKYKSKAKNRRREWFKFTEAFVMEALNLDANVKNNLLQNFKANRENPRNHQKYRDFKRSLFLPPPQQSTASTRDASGKSKGAPKSTSPTQASKKPKTSSQTPSVKLVGSSSGTVVTATESAELGETFPGAGAGAGADTEMLFQSDSESDKIVPADTAAAQSSSRASRKSSEVAKELIKQVMEDSETARKKEIEEAVRQKVAEDLKFREMAEEYLETRVSGFECNDWLECMRQHLKNEVKINLILFDGPWGVNKGDNADEPDDRLGRDRVIDDNALREGCRLASLLLAPDGNILAYVGSDDIGRWKSAMQDVGLFTQRATIAVVFKPSVGAQNRRKDNSMSNNVHYIVRAWRRGDHPHQDLSGKGKGYIDCKQAANTNIIDEYVPPLPQERLKSAKGRPLRIEEKSVNIMCELIMRFTKPGDLVGDFFFGAAPSCLAALELGRKWLGCDRDSNIVSLAKKRVLKVIESRLRIGTIPQPGKDMPRIAIPHKKFALLDKYINDLPVSEQQWDNTPKDISLEGGVDSVLIQEINRLGNRFRVDSSLIGPSAGKGLFAVNRILKGDVLGEYWGTVMSLRRRIQKYPTPEALEKSADRFNVDEWLVDYLPKTRNVEIDAHPSCLMRFINCARGPGAHATPDPKKLNVEAISPFYGTEDEELRKFLYQAMQADDWLSLLQCPKLIRYIAMRDIEPGEELLIDYSGVYWQGAPDEEFRVASDVESEDPEDPAADDDVTMS